MTDPSRRLSIAARAALELAIIVVGVLIALSADAWLEGRRDREAEVRHLVALREDMEESLRLLDTSNADRERLFAALVHLLEDDLDRSPPDTVSRWVYDGVFLIGRFQPRLAALEDLDASEQLGLLTPEVRRAIAELRRRLDDLAEVEDDFTKSQQGLVDPYLVERLPLASVLAVADSLPVRAALPPRPDWSALRSEHARGVMAFKLSLGKVATGFRLQTGEQMQAIIALADARLAELGRPP